MMSGCSIRSRSPASSPTSGVLSSTPIARHPARWRSRRCRQGRSRAPPCRPRRLPCWRRTAGSPGAPVVPRLVVTVMMRPALRANMRGSTARAIMIGAVALTVRKRDHCSGVASQKRIGLRRWSARIPDWPMPALLTSTSIPAELPEHVLATMRSNASGSARSAPTACSTPRAWRSRAVSATPASPSVLRSTPATSKPAVSSPSVIARPSPLAAPVTIATCLSAVAIGVSSGCRCCREWLPRRPDKARGRDAQLGSEGRVRVRAK